MAPNRKLNDDFPSDVEFQILSLLITPRHGRDIALRYLNVVGKSISYGTLYATLRRLRDHDWIEYVSNVGTSPDARVRRFRITGTGKRAFNRALLHHRQLVDMATAEYA